MATKDLRSFALNLAKNGPVKTLPTPRRVRILFKGACIADTLGTSGAIYVWEHEHYPQFYLPEEAWLEPEGFDTVYERKETIKDENGKKVATEWDIRVRPHALKTDEYFVLEKSLVFSSDLEGPGKVLRGLSKVDFAAAGKWLEEDTPIFVHPKDPFKRVDILTSTRPIRVEIDGRTIAETSASMHLYETSLPVRYYMPLTAIDVTVLRPSITKTQCPYKGEAEYYSVVIDGKEYKDIVWYYNRPTIECAAVAGMGCFYNEKVDIFFQEKGEWKKLERPKTLWS